MTAMKEKFQDVVQTAIEVELDKGLGRERCQRVEASDTTSNYSNGYSVNRQRSVFPSDSALLKALYLSTFEATKKWTMPIRNWGQVYGELSIMYEGRLPK